MSAAPVSQMSFMDSYNNEFLFSCSLHLNSCSQCPSSLVANSWQPEALNYRHQALLCFHHNAEEILAFTLAHFSKVI